MFDVYEHPWGLITVAIVVSLVLLMFRSISPEKFRWWLWLLPALLVLAAFGLDFLVETDLEKINTVINTGVKAFEDENPDLIEPLIADNYTDSYHSSKSVLMAHCGELLSEPLIEKNIKRIVSIDIQPPNATAIFTVRILFDKQSYVYQSFKSQMLVKVQTDLQKQMDNRWLINRVELLEIDMQPAGWKYIEQSDH
ncbi:MAG: hypothetical protein WAK60_12100 [Sedimentisphaerales bacterium]